MSKIEEKDRKKFDKLSKKLMKFLCKRGNPHMTIMITSTHAELVEGLVAINSTEFVVD